MASFALITEGITDQVVIETLLLTCLGPDTAVNPIQPLRDATDESRQAKDSYGGWERVLEWCNQSNFESILSVNDFIVLQLDTDVAEHPNFGLALTENGEDRSVEALLADVRTVIINKLGAAWPQLADRILFAIAVHSLECWILPLHAKTDADQKRTKNCAKRLAHLTGCKTEQDLKTYRKFEELVAPLQKSRKNKQWQQKLANCRQHNQSLAIFLDSLPTIQGA
jgi:hypothetical protein